MHHNLAIKFFRVFSAAAGEETEECLRDERRFDPESRLLHTWWLKGETVERAKGARVMPRTAIRVWWAEFCGRAFLSCFLGGSGTRRHLSTSDKAAADQVLVVSPRTKSEGEGQRRRQNGTHVSSTSTPFASSLIDRVARSSSSSSSSSRKQGRRAWVARIIARRQADRSRADKLPTRFWVALCAHLSQTDSAQPVRAPNRASGAHQSAVQPAQNGSSGAGWREADPSGKKDPTATLRSAKGAVHTLLAAFLA